MRVLEIEAHKMKLLIFFTALWAVAEVSSSGVTIGITPYSHPVQTQYHSQDVFGQYVYGYATPTSSKSETKTADGVTQGGYSYIDANGILQTVQYIADPIHGFRVAATNLPQDAPDVAWAKAQHLATVEATKAEHALIAAAQVQYTNPIAIPAAAVQQVPLLAPPAPIHDLPEVIRARADHLAAFEAVKARDLAQQVAISPVPAHLSGAVIPVQTGGLLAAPAPALSYAQNAHYAYAPNAHYSYVPAVPAVHQVAASTQYHAQDAIGQYSYGYVEPLSSKSETKTADGVVRGGYSYIDANGIVQTVNYISDPINGFRVAATNLPVGPAEIATAHAAIAAAPVAVAAPVAAAVPVAAPVVAAPPVTLTAPVTAPAHLYAAAPHAEVINTVATAPVAAPAHLYAAAPYAEVINTVATAPVGAPAHLYAAAPHAKVINTVATAPVAAPAHLYAAAPHAKVINTVATAPVAAPARLYAATPHAKVINTVPEPGWYSHEVYY